MSLLVSVLLLAGCLKPPITGSPLATRPGDRSVASQNAVPPLIGSVESFAYHAQASTIADIAVGSTVSLIDTSTNQTVATTVTDASGSFKIALSSSFQPTAADLFYLEAYKGLPLGGAPNRAGISMARVRTLVRFESGSWRHLHDTLHIRITTSSTALAVLASLRAASDSTRIDPARLLGSLAGDAFNPGSSGVAPDEFTNVRSLVVQCLASDQDPLYRVTYDVANHNYYLVDRGISITRVDPLVGPMGTRVGIEGTNLGLAPIVRFNGTLASSSVNALSTVIQADVPIGATSGPVTVQIGTIVFNGANFAVTPWDGHNVFDAVGNMYVGSRRDDRIYRFDPSGNLSLYVSDPLLDEPRGLVVAEDGSLYVACFNNDSIIKVAPDKSLSVVASGMDGITSLLRTSNGDLYTASYNTDTVYRIPSGTSTPETYVTGFPGAWGLAAGPNGVIYLSDYTQGKVFRIKSDRQVEQLAEGLDEPRGLAVDSLGNVFAACLGSHNVYKITPTGGLSMFVGMPHYPSSLAMNSNGTLYVGAYSHNYLARVDNTGEIRDFWSPGHLTWALKAQPSMANPTLYGSAGNNWGLRTQAVYRMTHNGTDYDPPTPVFRGLPNPSAIGPAQNDPNTLYIGDWNGFLFKGNIAAGSYTTYATGLGTVGDVTTDSAGNVYAGSFSGHALYRFTAANNYQAFGRSWYLNSGVFDAAGNLYVADRWYGKVLKIDPDGVITTYADNGGGGFGEAHGLAFRNGDLYVASWTHDRIYRIPSGGGAAVSFASISDVSGSDGLNAMVFDAAGNLYVASYHGKRIKVITPDGGTIRNYRLLAESPRALAIDGAGNLFVNAYNEGKVYKITPNVAGVSGNAPASFATGVGQCLGMYREANGDLLLSSYSDRVVYRVPSTGGAPTTVVSLPIKPGGVTRDAAGNLYVMTWDAANIYKFANGSTSYRLWAASLRAPAGIHVDEGNRVAFVTDYENYVLNMVDLDTGAISIAANSIDWPSGVRSLKGITEKDGKLYVNAWGAGVYELTLSGTTVTGATPWGYVVNGTGILGGIAFGAGGRLYGTTYDWVQNGSTSYVYHDPTGGNPRNMVNWPSHMSY